MAIEVTVIAPPVTSFTLGSCLCQNPFSTSEYFLSKGHKATIPLKLTLEPAVSFGEVQTLLKSACPSSKNVGRPCFPKLVLRCPLAVFFRPVVNLENFIYGFRGTFWADQ